MNTKAEREACFWRRLFIALVFAMIWKLWWLQLIQFWGTVAYWYWYDGFDPKKRSLTIHANQHTKAL